MTMLSSTKYSAFEQLKTRVRYWQHLTRIIQPHLPLGGAWQVVFYEQGKLILAGQNSSLNSQIRYLQPQFIQALQTVPEFQHLHQIQVVMANPPPTVRPPKPAEPLAEQTQQHLKLAASIVQNPKLSQALQRLASGNRNNSQQDNTD